MSCVLCQQRGYIYTDKAVASFFPVRGLKSQRNFCSQSCINILRILTKNSARKGKLKVKTFRYLKTKCEADRTTKGNAFIIDLFKICSGLKFCGGIETP